MDMTHAVRNPSSAVASRTQRGNCFVRRDLGVASSINWLPIKASGTCHFVARSHTDNMTWRFCSYNDPPRRRDDTVWRYRLSLMLMTQSRNLHKKTSDVLSCALFFLYQFLAPNRTKLYFVKKLVDTWPEFRALIGRPTRLFVAKVSCARTCVKIWYKKLVQVSVASFLTACPGA